MLAHAFFFYFFSFTTVAASLMVITFKNTVHSVFFLILTFITTGCLFIMIGAEFLGMILLIVYVGAVAVLFLFVVMMLNVAERQDDKKIQSKSTHIPSGLIVSLVILLEILVVIGGWQYKSDFIKTDALIIDGDITNTHLLGNVLYTQYIHLFQVAGVILLLAMIGAEFLGMILLIVYVGAVAVLFLFVVMMLNVAERQDDKKTQSKSTHIPS